MVAPSIIYGRTHVVQTTVTLVRMRSAIRALTTYRRSGTSPEFGHPPAGGQKRITQWPASSFQPRYMPSSHRRITECRMMWTTFLCLLTVCMLIHEVCEALTVSSCLVQTSESICGKNIKVRSFNSQVTIQLQNLIGPDDPELPDSDLHIQCTATEVTATFIYSGSDFHNSTSSYGVTWICEVVHVKSV